jgi:hypothetical protein
MGAPLQRILLVGCEPATLGPEEGQMGLSELVENNVDRAVTLTESLMTRILNGEWPSEVHEREEKQNLRKDNS